MTGSTNSLLFMVTYDYYSNTYQGSLDVAEFMELEPGVCRLIESYIISNIPYWKVQSLNQYDMDLNDIICIQTDFIAENGGKAALNGNSDFNITTVSTKGFNYQMKGKQVPMFNNVPLSPVMVTELRNAMRQTGLLSMSL